MAAKKKSGVKVEIPKPTPEGAAWLKLASDLNGGNTSSRLSELFYPWLTKWGIFPGYNDHKIWMRLMNLGVEPGHELKKGQAPNYSIEGFSASTLRKIIAQVFPQDYGSPNVTYDGMDFHVTVGSRTKKVSSTNRELIHHFNELATVRKKYEKKQHALALYIKVSIECSKNRTHSLARIYNASDIVRDCVKNILPYNNSAYVITMADTMKAEYKERENARRKEREKAQVKLIMEAIREFIEENDDPGMAFGMANMITYYARHTKGPASEKFIETMGKNDIHLGFRHLAVPAGMTMRGFLC